MSQLYSIAFYISWECKRKQNPALNWLNQKTKDFIEKEMELKVVRPIFGRELATADANKAIRKFRSALIDFHYEDTDIKARLRDTDGIENADYERKKNSVIGQARLTFSVFSKAKDYADTYSTTLPKLLREIMKISIETPKATLKITDYRTKGQVKEHLECWPRDADTVM